MIKFSQATLGKEEEQAVLSVMKSGWLAAGEKTKEFEEEFAKYVGVKYAIFTNSGTSALKMAYKYLRNHLAVKYMSTPKNTFSATYAAAFEMGIEIKNGCANRTTVHYGGVKDLSETTLEDSAHRIETNDPLIGLMRIYSFYVTKNMTTGSGGMLVTDDEEIYKKCRLYWQDGIDKTTYDRQHGGWNYEVKTMAGGYDGNDLAAAIGLEQLKKLPEFTDIRNRQRDYYNKAFGHTWEGNHLYPYFVNSEDEVASLINYLKDNKIQAGYHYPGTGWLGVSLPIYPLLNQGQQNYIIKTVKEWKR